MSSWLHCSAKAYAHLSRSRGPPSLGVSVVIFETNPPLPDINNAIRETFEAIVGAGSVLFNATLVPPDVKVAVSSDTPTLIQARLYWWQCVRIVFNAARSLDQFSSRNFGKSAFPHRHDDFVEFHSGQDSNILFRRGVGDVGIRTAENTRAS